ncbi:MAG: DUF1674 domain-containing protein [Sphingomonadaceae bacterium]|nr:DUF1674 domain-containing protein [Sphingomonadaceae bacterium]
MAGQRPAHVKPPAHLSKSPPIPEPEATEPGVEHGGRKDGLDPTRYGDWESKGIAVDF